ncbi:MAG TPA: membrane protein insertion efficiency factor YidD, partial [Pyrinomonadaceae bacterium]|nr:membrane protein insertion efficiency factor YidD [Pyrinomonadaceae bacterium]
MKRVLISFLKVYKLAISPLLPPSCRFVPTCSEYAVDAISRYGAA